MAGAIDLIRAKQLELAAAKAAAEKLAVDREKAAVTAFAETGIPAMWEQLKSVKVPHWRGNGSRENEGTELIPLKEHAKDVTATAIYLTDWDGGTKIAWYVLVTDKGAVRFVVGGRERLIGEYHKPEQLRDHFVDYMAKFLPPLEDK